MNDEVGAHPIFSRWTGQEHTWGQANQYSVSFGGRVLDTVVRGLDSFLQSEAPWPQWGRWPVALGCAPWLSDAEFVDRLIHGRFDTCIVINKPDSNPVGMKQPGQQAARLQSGGRGITPGVLRGFDWLAPKRDGQPVVVEPTGPHPLEALDEEDTEQSGLGPVRVAGVSKSATLAPLVHAKMILLGVMHDVAESARSFHPSPFYFEPKCLWLGSANFTWNSRRNIEFGLWLNEPSLLGHAERFLTDLISYSEPLSSHHRSPEPEWVPIEEDDAAIQAYHARFDWSDEIGDDDESN